MDALKPASTPDNLWLTVTQVMEFEQISRREVYSRLKPGDPRFLVSKPRDDGKPGVLICARSMTMRAQEHWRKDLLRKAGEPPEAPKGLFPATDVDRQIEALAIPRSERDLVIRRYRIVDLCLNHNWKAEGFSSKRAFVGVLAERNKTSVRSIQRWVLTWRQSGSLLDLVNDRPGPPPGSGTILDDDMRAHIVDCWTLRKLKPGQCYRSLVRYLEGKQNSPGCKVDYHYPIPSRATVERFIRSLSPLDHAARQGADELKAASGHIDRTYRDIRSLDRVDVDEWITDVLAYDPRKAGRVGRYYLLTFLDERSRYPLVWSLVERPNESDEIDLLCRLIREFGVPGLINSDRGRFRGKTFGGRFISQDREEMYRERDGVLDRLEIRRNLPREHNPRGSRLERFHLELANWARTIPGWCGSDTKQRRMTDADARQSQHRDWVRTGQGEPPLLSRDQLLERLNRFMAEFRQRPSEGNDMDGFAPEAVFHQNTPATGFRRIPDEELALKTAEHFEVLIRQGGIIQLRDGKRYFDPQLLLIQGERREAARLRHDHTWIVVLPSAKGEENIVAKRCVRVGMTDPDQLGQSIALQSRLRKLAGAMVAPMEYEPGSHGEAPNAAQVIHPSEFIAAQTGHRLTFANEAAAEILAAMEREEEAPPPTPEREISSSERMMEHNRYLRQVKPMDFADLED